jgi:hypothetical protein
VGGRSCLAQLLARVERGHATDLEDVEQNYDRFVVRPYILSSDV